MNNDNTLLPQYRFPEFKDDGNWDKLKVEEIITNESSSLSINKLEFLDSGYKLFGADGLVGYIDSYKQEDDYIAIIKDGSGAGRLSYYPSYSSVVGTLTYLKIKDKKLNDLKFQYYNLHNLDFKNHIKGGGIPHIYYSDYKNDFIGNPSSITEQQKIAECLSSLDDVIAGHEEKLTVLEEHKKGLMQNLFPQEGETQPKYRFPEFENDGDWVEKKLSEIGVLVNGLTYSPNDVSTEGILVLRSSNVQNSTISLEDNVYVNKTINEVNPIKLGDILICVRNGSKSLIGKNALIRKDMPNTTHGAFMTVFRSQQFEFVYQLFQSDLFFKQVHTDLGATINSINGRNLLNYKFVIPKNPLEQQKIASVLSSVDELIVAQREKIEALKVHKKGLMQGLFPKIES